MPITVGSNLASLRAQRRLSDSSRDLSKTFERLSSGQRINKASDDAAGLAVSLSLKNDQRVYTQGVRNFNDGVSLLNIADGALQELTNITVRLKELAEQSSNGTYGVQQRKALDAEAQALSKEYFRIERSTTYNGRGLFFSEFGDLRLQGSYGASGGIQSNLGGAIGTGTFGSVSTQGTTSSGGLRTADLNGDGNIDLIRGENVSTIVQLGRGDGTFGAETSFNSTIIANATEVGDVNGDGILDIVNFGTAGGSAKISVLTGKGDGTFLTAVSQGGFSGFASFAGGKLSDLNNDGKLDIVANNTLIYSVSLGTGNGSFTRAGTFGDYEVEDMALGDLNGDGITDLVGVGYYAAGNTRTTSVFLGRGDGSFLNSTPYFSAGASVFQYNSSVKLGDLNGDGILDLAVAGTGGDSYDQFFEVRFGASNGTFGTAVSTILTSTGAPDHLEVELGDINGDGNLDIAVMSDDLAAYTAQNTGRGTFAPVVTLTSMSFIPELELSDVNNDGVLDMVAGNAAKVRIGASASGISPLLPFKLTSRADALQALSDFSKTLNRLSTQRGVVGAFQSRLNVAGNVQTAAAENFGAAEGRIRNADIAEESSQLSRLTILQKAASAVLAQANLQPEIALKLLHT
jgi:flagellin